MKRAKNHKDRIANRLANIVLIEDNEADIAMARFVFEDMNLCNDVEVIMDGERALRRLLRQAEYKNAPQPDIVLLDLHLPGLDGTEILQAVHESTTGNVPTVLLTGCEEDALFSKRRNAGADCYLVKPLTVSTLMKAIRAISNLQLSLVTAETE